MHIACADIGSVPQGNFAWAASDGAEGALPSELAAHVARLLNSGESVALGFECPLFVPVPEVEGDLGKGRIGEGSRPWSAAAGSSALATGLAQVAWVLARTRSLITVPASGHLNWDEFSNAAPGSLLVWEAFVTGAAKGANHIQDAQLAVQAFKDSLPSPATASAICVQGVVHSLAGAALLSSDWSSKLALLKQECIVIRVGESVARARD